MPLVPGLRGSIPTGASGRKASGLASEAQSGRAPGSYPGGSGFDAHQVHLWQGIRGGMGGPAGTGFLPGPK